MVGKTATGVGYCRTRKSRTFTKGLKREKEGGGIDKEGPYRLGVK